METEEEMVTLDDAVEVAVWLLSCAARGYPCDLLIRQAPRLLGERAHIARPVEGADD